MKTFRELKEWVGFNFPSVADATSVQAVDDVDTAAFSVETPDVLDKLNAYTQQIASHQYINPYYPINTLWKKLSIVGINFDLKAVLFPDQQGKVVVPLNQYGGRYGTLGGPEYVSSDDGISHRLPGGLNLEIMYQKTGGVYSLDARIVRGLPEPPPFVEEVKKK